MDPHRPPADRQNYRISLANEDVREFAESDQLDQLLGADQVGYTRRSMSLVGG